MANDNGDRDDESADSQGKCVRIDMRELCGLFTFTGETIYFEDHGDFAVVDFDDFEWLEFIAMELAKQLRRGDTR